MISHEYKFRVKYPETDQMGTVHHSEYAKYYEVARWELFRNIGIPYKSFEDAGFLLPVTRMNFRFIKTIGYDELLSVKTTLKAVKGVRIWFEYKLYNENNALVNEAETELACISKGNWKPCAFPQTFYNAIESYQKKIT